jgi:hypothetical protein
MNWRERKDMPVIVAVVAAVVIIILVLWIGNRP